MDLFGIRPKFRIRDFMLNNRKDEFLIELIFVVTH